MLDFKTKTFDELSLQELYAILALRAEVFVVEQNCPYQDVDGKDEKEPPVGNGKGATLAIPVFYLKEFLMMNIHL